MADAKIFCTCKDTNCPLHPVNHDQGCTLCIAKNLKTKEMPNCYFDLIENCPPHEDYSLETFANCVHHKKIWPLDAVIFLRIFNIYLKGFF